MLQRRVFWYMFAMFALIDAGSILNQAYARVAKWGAVDNNGEGRSSGQTFFTQSADVKLRSGQNLKHAPKEEKVVYQYSMPAQKLHTSQTKASGFQDRFNPPPAFQFGDSKRNVADDHHNHNHNYDQGPVYTPPKKVSYDSPISSYNPIASGLPTDVSKFPPSGPSPKYPPFSDAGPTSRPPSDFKGPLINFGNDYDADSDSNGPGPGSTPGDGYQYNAPTAPPMLPTPGSAPPSKPHYRFPPYVFDMNDTHTNDDYLDHLPGPGVPGDYDDHDHEPPQGQTPKPQNQHNQDAPTSQGHDAQDQNSPPDYPDYGKPSLSDLPEYLDHDPSQGQGQGYKGKFSNFPLWSQFQLDDHGSYDDHHPVTTTTTTPQPEDENRVNKGHYSYYYLGRKLYYVPLYFSVYFIIYITVLILKSITRHKVNFVHELDNVKVNGRSLGDVGQVQEQAERTTRAIREFKRRYIAM